MSSTTDWLSVGKSYRPPADSSIKLGGEVERSIITEKQKTKEEMKNKSKKKKKHRKRHTRSLELSSFEYESHSDGERWGKIESVPVGQWVMDKKADVNTSTYETSYCLDDGAPQYSMENSTRSSRKRRRAAQDAGETRGDSRYYDAGARARVSSDIYESWERHEKSDGEIGDVTFIPLDFNDKLAHADGALSISGNVGSVQEKRDYSQSVRENPHSIATWVMYADFQDEGEVGASAHAILDRKIAIFNRAVRANPSSATLWLALLCAAAGSESYTTIEKLHKKALVRCSHASPIWKSYLRHHLHGFSTFTMSGHRNLVATALHAVESGIDPSNPSPDAQIVLELTRVDILGFIVCVERSSGSAEHALGLLQALVEMNILLPTVATASFYDSATLMAEFWEDEYPRVGDDAPSCAGITSWIRQRAYEVPFVSPNQGIARAAGRLRQRAADFFEDPDDEIVKGGVHPCPSAHQSAVGRFEEAYKAVTAVTAALIGVHKEVDESTNRDLADEDEKHEEISGGGLQAPMGSAPPSQAKAALEAEGLLWVNQAGSTAYSIDHGRRINISNVAAARHGQDYRNILAQVRGSNPLGAVHSEVSGDIGAVSHRICLWVARREEEARKELEGLQPVPRNDELHLWSVRESKAALLQWQPVRASFDIIAAESQPERVIFWEDFQEKLFHIRSVAGQTLLVASLLVEVGIYLPLCASTHSPAMLRDLNVSASFVPFPACAFGDSMGLTRVFRDLSGQNMPGVKHFECMCDQLVLLSQDVLLNSNRQKFARNVLYSLVAAGGGLGKSGADDVHTDLGVHLQCCLLVMEGLLLRHVNILPPSSGAGLEACLSDQVEHVARPLLEASGESAADLRLWCAYLQMLESCGEQKKALRVAHKLLGSIGSHAPKNLRHIPALFWLIFRMEMGLPLSVCSDVPIHRSHCPAPLLLQEEEEGAIHTLVSMAEGSSPGELSRGERNLVVGTLRVLGARQLFAQRLREEAKALNAVPAGGPACSTRMDSTPPFFYYAAALMWLELLCKGAAEASQAMDDAIRLLVPPLPPSAHAARQPVLSSTSPPSYDWQVQADYGAKSVCLGRCHRARCELMKFAIAHRRSPGSNRMHMSLNAPRLLRKSIIAGLQQFPCDVVLLQYLFDVEKKAGHAQTVAYHMNQAVVARRRHDWPIGPTPQEWMLSVAVGVQRCISEAQQQSSRSSEDCCNPRKWSAGAICRLRRVFERAVSHDTGRHLPLIWRMYIRTEVATNSFSRARRLFLRAVHACPSSKELWLDAARRGVLREVFSSKEVEDFLEVARKKELYFRCELPNPSPATEDDISYA